MPTTSNLHARCLNITLKTVLHHTLHLKCYFVCVLQIGDKLMIILTSWSNWVLFFIRFVSHFTEVECQLNVMLMQTAQSAYNRGNADCW